MIGIVVEQTLYDSGSVSSSERYLYLHDVVTNLWSWPHIILQFTIIFLALKLDSYDSVPFSFKLDSKVA
jgi:hypothetical protein